MYLTRVYDVQWRSQNAINVTHIKGILLDRAVILLIAPLFIMGTSLKGKNLLPESLRAVLFGMENHFYHIRLPPLNVTIFITHVRNLRNECYANVSD